MADFSAKKINSTTELNNGKGQYINGVDIPNAEDWNKVINSQLYVQSLATNEPDVSEADNVGTPTVTIEELPDGSARFKFRNLKGDKGDVGATYSLNGTTLYITLK